MGGRMGKIKYEYGEIKRIRSEIYAIWEGGMGVGQKNDDTNEAVAAAKAVAMIATITWVE